MATRSDVVTALPAIDSALPEICRLASKARSLGPATDGLEFDVAIDLRQLRASVQERVMLDAGGIADDDIGSGAQFVVMAGHQNPTVQCTSVEGADLRATETALIEGPDDVGSTLETA